jgi:hypothetical protein
MKHILIKVLLTGFFYQTTVAQYNADRSQFHIGSSKDVIYENTRLNHSIRLTAYSFVAQNSVSNQGFGDSTPVKMSDSMLAEKYLKKGRGLETGGFVLLGLGLPAGIGGYIGYKNNNGTLEDGNWFGYALLIGVGVALTITGAAILAGGLRYKKKARLLMQNENVSSFYHIPVKGKMYSAGFAISLR